MVMTIEWIDCLLEFWDIIDMRIDIERLHPSKNDTLVSKFVVCEGFDRGFCSPMSVSVSGSKLHRWNGTQVSPTSRVMWWR